MRLGVQVSSAGKIYYAIDRAKTLDCNTMQIFARNPRQWRKASLSQEDIAIFKERVQKEKISPVAVHIPYTLNLATAKPHFYKVTIKEFIADLIEADKLGAQYLITHMGSHRGISEEEGLSKIAKALEEILKATEGTNTMILLENTSGSGKWLGYTFSHHRIILGQIDFSLRVGICFDTAHAWAAGYKIDEKNAVDELVNEIDREIGIERLKVIHLNDTQTNLGSRHDRHFDIGEGNIGKNGFSYIFAHPSLRDLPFILETPKKSDEDDLRNLDMARRLYKNAILQRN
ncbi:MAG: deoxyribonuclease IV [Candidatus Omnitrophota bacterium]|nr:MAG: deoxyribonuclease IV [Candidatus Omnitrophota bacterium]